MIEAAEATLSGVVEWVPLLGSTVCTLSGTASMKAKTLSHYNNSAILEELTANNQCL